VREVSCRIAVLGGFLARKCDGEPGVKTLWQGFTKVSSFVRGVEKTRETHMLCAVWNGMPHAGESHQGIG